MAAKKDEETAVKLLEAAEQSYPAVSAMEALCDQVIVYAKRYQELLIILGFPKNTAV